MTSRLDRVTNVVLVLCALLVTFFALQRRLFPSSAPSPAPTVSKLPDAQWLEIKNASRALDAGSQQLIIAEFADVECPFCKRAHSDLSELRKEFGDRISFRLVHFPLTQHRFARPGARALECAGAQSAMPRMLDVLYEVGSSRVDLQACKLEYSIVSPK